MRVWFRKGTRRYSYTQKQQCAVSRSPGSIHSGRRGPFQCFEERACAARPVRAQKIPCSAEKKRKPAVYGARGLSYHGRSLETCSPTSLPACAGLGAARASLPVKRVQKQTLRAQRRYCGHKDAKDMQRSGRRVSWKKANCLMSPL
jgi:hypothetical protein